MNGQPGTVYPDSFFDVAAVPVVPGTNTLTATYTGPAYTNVPMTATDTSTVVLGDTAYTHDANGNLTSDATFLYQYDLANQLTNVTRKSDSAVVLQCRYDALGRRVEAIRSDGAVDRYVYFPGSFLVLAVLDENNAPKELYTRGPDLRGSLDSAGGIGGILACTYATGPVLYHHADLMGHIIALTDPSGSVASTFRYTPFGQLAAFTGDSLSRFLFCSKEYGSALLLIHYGFRYYNSKNGIWISRDLLHEYGGLNLYSGMANNTMMFVDSWGLHPAPEGCRIHYFYEREDENGLAVNFLHQMQSRILEQCPCADLKILIGNPVSGKSIRKARYTADLIVIVGHGVRVPKKYGSNLVDPNDFTLRLQSVTNPDSPGGISPTLEQLFPETKHPKGSALNCVVLGTCNNGYAPEHLPDGTEVIRVHPNVHDHPLEKNSYPRPSWDHEDYQPLRGSKEPGATNTSVHWKKVEEEILKYLRNNGCCCDN